MCVGVCAGRMLIEGSGCVSVREPSEGRGAAERSGTSSGSSVVRARVSACERACVREGLEGRGEADAAAAGLPGEGAGVGEQTQPLSPTAGAPGARDEAQSAAPARSP